VMHGFSEQLVALREFPCEHQKRLRLVFHIRDIDLVNCPIICNRDLSHRHTAEDTAPTISSA